MKVIDITGPIYNGMWYFGDPWPIFKLRKRNFKLGDINMLIEDFEGMGGHTGLYLETPSIIIGNETSYTLSSVPIEKLVNVDAYAFFRPEIEKRERKKDFQYAKEDIDMLRRKATNVAFCNRLRLACFKLERGLDPSDQMKLVRKYSKQSKPLHDC